MGGRRGAPPGGKGWAPQDRRGLPREGGRRRSLRPGAAPYPSPALHTKGPRDPASCSRRRAGPGLCALFQSLLPGRVSGPRLPRASSGLSGASRLALGPRPAGRDGQGTVSGRGYGLGKGPLPEPPASSLFPPGCPQLLFLLLMLRTVPPRPRGSLSASQLPPARPEDSIHSWRI